MTFVKKSQGGPSLTASLTAQKTLGEEINWNGRPYWIGLGIPGYTDPGALSVAGEGLCERREPNEDEEAGEENSQ